MNISIQDLMIQSGVAFGTSGARGLASAMTDLLCYSYTKGFIQFLEQVEKLKKGEQIAIAGDLRESTPRITQAVFRAITDSGYSPLDCGLIPTPALIYYGITKKIPSIMITGSHIPADRNGIKFNKKEGEVLKPDEALIREQMISFNESLFSPTGAFTDNTAVHPLLEKKAEELYKKRYTDFFPANALTGLTVAVYEHSAVGRKILADVLNALGAKTILLGKSSHFIPVDTEAITEELAIQAKKWAKENSFNAIVSTDGDSDRPLLGDEKGNFFSGDLCDILTAKYFNADSVTATVSTNTALELSVYFKETHRSKIGSPYVIASMRDSTKKGAKRAVGYEGNGGFLINSDITTDGKTLKALPTRDALIVILSILAQTNTSKLPVASLFEDLPQRFTSLDVIHEFPTEKSNTLLNNLFNTGDETADRKNIKNIFGTVCGEPKEINRLDGTRIIFQNGEIIHIRPSGNAPELRVYTESNTEEQARLLNKKTLEILRNMS